MAKYFGNRAHWAQPKPSGAYAPTASPTSPMFMGTPQGGPPARMGMEGQIIPPNRGQYPRGKSLPGYATPRTGMGSQMAAMRAAGRAQMMRGMLGRYLGLPFLLGDFMTAAEWFAGEITGEVDPATAEAESLVDASIAGYTLTCGNGPGCVGWESDDPWAWGATNAWNPAFCNQCLNWPLGHPTWADLVADWSPPVWNFGAPATLAYGQKTAAFTDNVRSVWRRNGTGPETQWPPVVTTTVPKTRYLPNTLAPPRAEAREKSYPRAVSKPRARVWGDGLPPTGVPVKTPWPPHVPPPPNVREKKGLVFGGGKWGKAYGAATEFRDWLDCMGGSMPGNPCKKYKNQLHKYAACIAANHALIDMPAATVCMHEEGAKDAAHGLPDRMGTPSDNPFYQRPAGPTTGFWSQPSAPSMTKM